MKNALIFRKMLAALAILSFFSIGGAFAATQEECVAAVNACYDSWVPDWWCDRNYRKCRETWT